MQAEIKKAIETYDPKNVLESMVLFPDQCALAWNTEPASKKYKNIKNILVIGMGGSTLGAYMLQSLNISTVPIFVYNEYTIPAWVNEDTLVLAMSYSGNTEETVSAMKKAIPTGATILCISTGGMLCDIAKENNIPIYKIDTTQNPCGQPRFCVGAMMMEILKICDLYNVCKLSREEINESLAQLRLWAEGFKLKDGIDAIYSESLLLKDKIPVLIHSEHLANVGRFMRNQINETSKTLAIIHEIPELNHHLLEGLEFPKSNKEKLYFIFFESNLFTDKIKKRIAVTKDVIEKQGIECSSVHVNGTTPLSQVLISMLRDMYTAYTLGLIHEKNPNDVGWVNYFKEQLG